MKKVLFIGQAPPEKIQDQPFGRTRLYKWLEEAGISESKQKNFYFSALVHFSPGKNKSGSGDRAPNPLEIEAGRAQLKALIKKTKPDVIVPVGILSTRLALQNQIIKLEDVVGKKFLVDPYNLLGKKNIVIPIPHPSGASRWVWQDDHGKLVKNAVQLLAQELFT